MVWVVWDSHSTTQVGVHNQVWIILIVLAVLVGKVSLVLIVLIVIDVLGGFGCTPAHRLVYIVR